MNACTPIVCEARPYVTMARQVLERAETATNAEEMRQLMAKAAEHMQEAEAELQVRQTN